MAFQNSERSVNLDFGYRCTPVRWRDIPEMAGELPHVAFKIANQILAKAPRFVSRELYYVGAGYHGMHTVRVDIRHPHDDLLTRVPIAAGHCVLFAGTPHHNDTSACVYVGMTNAAGLRLP